MTPQEILIKAVQCDDAGRILEAQTLYQEGIEMLMQLVEKFPEADGRKKKVFYARIKEYLERAEQIKERVLKCMEQGELVKHVAIDNDSTGNSYNSLFGSYLDDSIHELLIEEPYLYEKYQFTNLIVFLELMLKKCPNLTYVRLVTKTYQRALDVQRNNLNEVTANLKSHKVTIKYIFEDTLHDRKIILSNGYIIKIGRGLHFFKPSTPLALGISDYDYRKCLQTDVDVWRCSNFKQ